MSICTNLRRQKPFPGHFIQNLGILCGSRPIARISRPAQALFLFPGQYMVPAAGRCAPSFQFHHSDAVLPFAEGAQAEAFDIRVAPELLVHRFA